jgi:hypothetical protein
MAKNRSNFFFSAILFRVYVLAHLSEKPLVFSIFILFRMGFSGAHDLRDLAAQHGVFFEADEIVSFALDECLVLLQLIHPLPQ